MNQQILNQFFRLAEKSFIVLGLSFFSGVFGGLSLGLVLPRIVISFLTFFVFGTSIFLNLIFWKNTLFIISRNLLLFLLTALAYFSFIWSYAPDISISVSRDILMMTSFAIYFAARFSLKEIVELVALTLFLGAIVSTICAIGVPQIGMHIGDVHAGAWKGIYNYKNQFGSIMNIMCLTFFALPNDNSKKYKYFGIYFSIFLMLLSTSKTSLVICLSLISIIFFYKKYRWKGRLSVILLNLGTLIIGCFTIFIFTYWVEILTGLGRDATLTGRTPIWGVIISRLMEKPFLGYGCGAFFAPNSPYAFEAGQALRTGWIAPSGHNGFLDLALDVGLIGLVLFLILYSTNFISALKRAYATHNREHFFPLAYLIFIAMNNITESLLLGYNNIQWTLFITVCIILSQKELIPENSPSNGKYSYTSEISLSASYQSDS